jgi:hypothetical protein
MSSKPHSLCHYAPDFHDGKPFRNVFWIITVPLEASGDVEVIAFPATVDGKISVKVGLGTGLIERPVVKRAWPRENSICYADPRPISRKGAQWGKQHI